MNRLIKSIFTLRLVSAGCLLLAGGMFLSGCNNMGDEPEEYDEFPAGFLMYDVNNQWNKDAYQYSFDRAKSVGLIGAWAGSHDMVKANQDQSGRDLGSNGAKVRAVCPENIALEFLRSLEIPVVMFDSRVEGFQEDCFVGYDYTEAAGKAAEFIAARIPSAPCKVLAFTIKSDRRTAERAEMFRKKMAQSAPEAEVVVKEFDMYSDDDRNNEVKMSILQQLVDSEDIVAIYANDDDMAYFVYRAIDGSVDRDKISGRVKAVFGCGGSNRMHDVIKNSSLTGVEFATIECNPNIAETLTDVMVDALRFGKFSQSTVMFYPGKVIDKSNASPQ
ncbi:MAG: substrate-binding domain-containing protein [Rikenellaceae bacterium]|nr:substrate-binding domain-containing protein [Rikenellaceae bacterium]